MALSITKRITVFFRRAALIGAAMLLLPGIGAAQLGCEVTIAFTGGLQSWTVPPGVTSIRIIAAGGQGGGLAANVAGDFSVIPGETLQIIVAGQGNGTGGGGATFIARGSNGFSDFIAANMLLIAGGGGGDNTGQASTVFQSNAAGSGGIGGNNTDSAGGGGGSAGGDGLASMFADGGKAAINGAAGGEGGSFGRGGFGGGGGGDLLAGGGGGGATGGNGGNLFGGGSAGTSYNGGSNPVNTPATQTGNGNVIIKYNDNITLTASIADNGGPICAGGDATFTVSGTDGTMLTYTITGEQDNQTLALNGTNQTIIGSSATANVTLTLVSVSNGNCSQNLSGNSTVMVNSLPTVSIDASATTVCAGTLVTLTASEGTSYQWNNGVTTRENIIDTGGPNGDPGPGGGYSGPRGPQSVTVTNVAGCSATATITLTINDLPMASISPATATVCEGQPVTLTASGGISYEWNTGESTAAITVTAIETGTYTVTVSGVAPTGDTGARIMDVCSAEASAIVNVIPFPTASIVTNNTPICLGSDASFTVIGTEGATLIYTITGQTGNQTLDLNGTNQIITESGTPANVTLTLVSVTKSDCLASLSTTSTVTKVDNTPPTITCPVMQTLVLDANCSAMLPDYISLAIPDDNCGVQGVTQLPAAGTTVSEAGDINVTLTVTDINGNPAECSFTVIKVDNTAPTITCPGTQSLMLNANCSATLPNYVSLASSYDNCGVQSVTQSPIAGTTVSVAGNMTVTLMVTDVNGLFNSCTFTVMKVDNELPIIECFNQTINFNGQMSTPLNTSDLVASTDNCGVGFTVLSPSSISITQVGQTVPVEVTVTDINGNTAFCTSQVTVSGLPPGWSQNVNGIGCSNGNDLDYNTATEVWTATSTNCYYSSPFNADASGFAQRTLCGDGSITAQVSGISGTAPGWAGVVMRVSNDPGAKKAQLTTNMSNFSRREFRTMTNGSAFPQQFPSQNRRWLRIVRTGNQFVMYISPNGISWAFAGAQNIQMNSCIEIGLVATNYNANSTVTATFANVAFTGNGSMQYGLQTDNGNIAANAQYGADFSVYPNPTSGEVNIHLEDYSGRNARIEIYGVEGKLIQWIRIDEVQGNIETLHLDTYPNGLYLVKLKSEGLPAVTKRLVLAKN